MNRNILILLLILICSSQVFTQDTEEGGKVIRVLTYNILHGATTRGDFDLDIIAGVITDVDPDFVALQEVDFKTNRAKKYDLVTELGWRTKMASIFGKAMDYDGGGYGEGILSKYSFVQTRNVALPHSPGNEPRAALEITTVLPSGDTIAIIGTHLDHLENEYDRVLQATRINEVFSLNRYPTILAGDLNAVPGSAPIEILENIWTPSYDKDNPQPTFPSDDPEVKIDYIMFYPQHKWRVLKTEVIRNTIASDHCAYLVTVELLE